MANQNMFTNKPGDPIGYRFFNMRTLAEFKNKYSIQFFVPKIGENTDGESKFAPVKMNPLFT